MIRRLRGSLRVAARRGSVGLLGFLLVALWVVPASVAGEQQAEQARQTQLLAENQQAARAAQAEQAEQKQQGEQRQAQQQVLTWTADNSITDYATVPETATAGPTTIVFENSTATGNTSGMVHTLTFDVSNPEYNQDVDTDITASPFDANQGRWEMEVNLTPGQYRYFCAIPGHGQMEGVLTVTEGGGGEEDTTAPTVSAEVTGEQDGDGNYLGSATVAVSAEDDDSGVASVEYQVDGGGFEPYSDPVAVSEPGEHTVEFRATDNAGNVSETGSVTFTVVEGGGEEDTTAPTVSGEVTGTQDADGNYVGSATVAVTAQDDDSGVASVEYQLDDGDFLSYEGPVRVADIGSHTVQFRATDNAGNVSEPGSVEFTVVEPPEGDETPPHVMAEVTGEQNEQEQYLGSAIVELTAHDEESGVDTVEYALDGGEFTAYTEPVVVSAVGEHTVQYRATDNSGNTSEPGSVTFTVVEGGGEEDTTPPEVSAEVAGEQDDDGNYVGSATVTVAAADDGSGVDTVEYALDGGEFTAYTDPVEVAEAGEHTVEFRATDNAGNVAEPGSVTFTVVEGEVEDTTPPEVVVTLSGEQDADWNYLESARLTLTATDEQSGVSLIEYSFTDAGFRPYRVPITIADAGVYTVQYRATDNAGNVSEAGATTFRIVDAGPTCTVSDTRATVVVGGDDTGVANADTGGGCTIMDRIDEGGNYSNHTAFVTHVRQVTSALVADGIITKDEKQRIVQAVKRTGNNGNNG
ncbi:OmpL47-type beta-barrel domain-containing protein [Prauserella cavernicola]|uniref:Ig-like domain repeat protein n=1 Tax=Prauserella cavernicola TaxID=2800127 RepID=A0A934QM58_9PSEU|nr:Ig-like domain repeat protein [Prauserella cavernicola]MBK1782705.1 Ig-like domain repeat protein [Prauserella cavernicola]